MVLLHKTKRLGFTPSGGMAKVPYKLFWKRKRMGGIEENVP